ncbi:multidrug resistance-associated protein 1-like isoform X3 [Saccostrea echinata]|uniref:multidrug resistance-associated protein 1-like isoform X3 n=1 Tax=Saccostrea echinata TaxID=191078 RepID=UPI002A7F7AC9|nr:multidrug resistance-associated protein 1-like isoform X3 [Saccostrea echinata]
MGIGHDFCDDALWDSNQTWYTEDPDFTPCFQKTVLLWVPCIYLIFLSPARVFSLTESRKPSLNFTSLNVLKTALAGWIAVIAVLDTARSVYSLMLGSSVPAVEFVSPLLLFLTMVFCVIMIQYERRRGVHSSGYLLIFWLLLSIYGILMFQSRIRGAIMNGISDIVAFATFQLYFPAILVEFILASLVDGRQRLLKAYSHNKRKSPEEMASFLSKITFWWFTRMVIKGYKDALVLEDLWYLNYEDTCRAVVPYFEKYWYKEVKRSMRKAKRKACLQDQSSVEMGTIQKDGDHMDITNESHNKLPAKLFRALVSAYLPAALVTALLKLIYDVMQFISPLLLKLLIKFIEDKSEYFWRGILYAVLMFVMAMIQSFVLHQYFHGCQLLGMRIRTSVTCLVYRKMLRLSNASKRSSTVGEIVNLMSVDAQRFMDLMTYIHTIWSGPFQIIVALYFLYMELGPSIFAGFGVMIVLIPINALIAKKTRDLQVKQMTLKDGRIKMMNEVLNGIKASVSLNRLQKFLNHSELDNDAVQKDKESKYAVVIENGTFAWEKVSGTVTLKKINIKIPERALVAVVGPVGSGKSSILSAILGDIEKSEGKVTVKGSIAYVAQQAWIQNATLRDNVLFGKIKIEPDYSEVIDNCELNADLEILPAGDMTEIGEKGINLSGGQKQRVSLARAVYQNNEIYLLDDPLSAVDAHVGKHIFENVIGPNSCLKNKTRILVTHGLGFLPYADLIVTVNEGEVSEVGTFHELMNRSTAFSDFVHSYLSQKTQDDKHDVAERNLEDFNKGDLVSLFGPFLEEEEKTRLRQFVEGSQKNMIVSGQRSEEKIILNSSLPVKEDLYLDSMQHLKSSKPFTPQKYVAQKKLSEFCHEHEAEDETENLLKEIEKKEKEDKLIQDEKVEKGMVKFAVFRVYLKSVGAMFSIVTILFYVLYNAASIYSNIWLSEWSGDPYLYINGTNGTVVKEINVSQRNLRLGIYGVLGILQGIFTIIASLSLYIGNIHAGKALHASLVNNILSSPMKFFDTTPLGRIMNRFSKDVDVLDTQIGRIYESWLSCLLKVISVPIVIGYSTPYFLVVFLPLALLYVAVQRFYVATSRQLKRLESTLRSPIFSHFGESISGVSTIRAYGQQSRFISDSERKVDENNQCYFPSIVSNRWLAVRLEFVGNCVVFFACLFAVLERDTLSGGIVGLSVTYALNVTQTLNWLVRMTTELETNIVAVERVKEYSEIPTEAPKEIAETKPHSSWPQKGEIVFENYGLRYREGLDLVLKDISCKIQPAEKVLLVEK